MSDELRLMLAFPGLAAPSRFRITSPKDVKYNCVAYAAGDQQRFWWPDRMNQYYWPSGVPRQETLAACIAAFETLGFAVCDNPSLEPGFEKIALFTKPAGTPTHAARQFPDGTWRSKLGRDLDIEHELRAVEGREYGAVAVFMKRAIVAQS